MAFGAGCIDIQAKRIIKLEKVLGPLCWSVVLTIVLAHKVEALFQELRRWLQSYRQKKIMQTAKNAMWGMEANTEACFKRR